MPLKGWIFRFHLLIKVLLGNGRVTLWKAITFLCGYLSLCGVVSSLCLVVTSLCLVVTSLCLVVTSLCLVVTSLCLVVSSLCLVVCSLCGLFIM